MEKPTENGQKLKKFVAQKFEADQLNNTDLLQLIELAGDYLNLKTIADYAKHSGISYNGVKNHRNTTVLFGVKFVADNE